jgi:hypothetical protein
MNSAVPESHQAERGVRLHLHRARDDAAQRRRIEDPAGKCRQPDRRCENREQPGRKRASSAGIQRSLKRGQG